MANRKSSAASAGDFRRTTPRHLWLAALGAAAVARRTSLAALDAGFDRALRLQREAARVAADVRDVARGAALTVEEVVVAQVQPQVSRLGAEIEARLAPLLDRAKAKASPRKPVRKARKSASTKPARRSAGARKQAAARVARKGRG